MIKKKAESGMDLLAKAMRKVFDEQMKSLVGEKKKQGRQEVTRKVK